MIGLHKSSVAVYPYDKSWPEEFEKEKKILKNILKDFDVEIEHVGSTSIPGLSAKPIIDIAIGAKDEKTLFKLESVMAEAGYDILNDYETKAQKDAEFVDVKPKKAPVDPNDGWEITFEVRDKNA